MRVPTLDRFVRGSLPAWLVLLAIPTRALPFETGDPPPAPTHREPQRPSPVARDGLTSAGQSAASGFVIDTTSRETVRNWFNAVYRAADNPVMGWTGVYTNCDAGTTDPAFRSLVALRINYLRALAGVPATITLDDTFNAAAQQAALMMSANNALNHFPPADWSCYTDVGYNAAGHSNLGLGASGPEAVRGYIEDFGQFNAEVGHRRWLLYPQTQQMGTGDVPGTSTNWPANATWVMDGSFGQARPATRDGFVSWPPPGFVPYPLVYARWSLSFPDADFTAANVNFSSNGVPVPVVLETVQTGFGENTLVWHPDGMDTTQPFVWPRPVADTVFVVDVSNVGLAGTTTNFHYTVTVMDPDVPGADAVTAALSGPAQVALGQQAFYQFPAIPAAGAYQWRLSQRTAFNRTDIANDGLRDFVINTSPGYNVITNPSPWIAGPLVHLEHVAPAEAWLPPTDQLLTCGALLLARTNSQLQFGSWVGYGSTNQFAKVQISLDAGASWTDIFQRPGNGTNAPLDGVILSLHTVTIPLRDLAGSTFQLRFNYHCDSGAYFLAGDMDGWYLNNITFSGLEAVTNAVVHDLGGASTLNLAPDTAGNYLLELRGLVDGYPLAWGPAQGVSVAAGPRLQLTGPPTLLAGGKVSLNFSATNLSAGTVLRLETAGNPGGGWAVDASAALLIKTDGSYNFTTPAATNGAGAMFFRVRAD